MGILLMVIMQLTLERCFARGQPANFTVTSDNALLRISGLPGFEFPNNATTGRTFLTPVRKTDKRLLFAIQYLQTLENSKHHKNIRSALHTKLSRIIDNLKYLFKSRLSRTSKPEKATKIILYRPWKRSEEPTTVGEDDLASSNDKEALSEEQEDEKEYSDIDEEDDIRQAADSEENTTLEEVEYDGEDAETETSFEKGGDKRECSQVAAEIKETVITTPMPTASEEPTTKECNSSRKSVLLLTITSLLFVFLMFGLLLSLYIILRKNKNACNCCETILKEKCFLLEQDPPGEEEVKRVKGEEEVTSAEEPPVPTEDLKSSDSMVTGKELLRKLHNTSDYLLWEVPPSAPPPSTQACPAPSRLLSLTPTESNITAPSLKTQIRSAAGTLLCKHIYNSNDGTQTGTDRQAASTTKTFPIFSKVLKKSEDSHFIHLSSSQQMHSLSSESPHCSSTFSSSA